MDWWSRQLCFNGLSACACRTPNRFNCYYTYLTYKLHVMRNNVETIIAHAVLLTNSDKISSTQWHSYDFVLEGGGDDEALTSRSELCYLKTTKSFWHVNYLKSYKQRKKRSSTYVIYKQLQITKHRITLYQCRKKSREQITNNEKKLIYSFKYIQIIN